MVNKIQDDKSLKYKYLYLRNIYTNNMYVIGKINANKIDKYTYDFNKDNQIVINGKTLKRNKLKLLKMLYVKYSFKCYMDKSKNIRKYRKDLSHPYTFNKEFISK